MQSFYLGLNSRVDLFRLNISKQPIEVAPRVIGYIRKKLVVYRNIPNLGNRPVNILIKENDCVRRPLNRADVETHLIVCARIEGPKNDRTHALRNGFVRFPELQLSKPRPVRNP